uniref:Uncharacterized protein n=1 Tax=Arundo donax TaxID=35708 RepID=A0A0A9BUT0_ARUDO
MLLLEQSSSPHSIYCPKE